jgi:hypothetical protein
MYQDFGNGDRTDDAINDYLENKAGVEAAYADMELPLKDREEILKNAVMFTEAQGYAEGGSVEYNPITVDQIIDATHQELGTGRYAKGGSVNKMQAIPQNENLAALAEALSKGRDIGNKVELPYIGGIGDLLVGKTPEEIENWSYGNAPMQIPEMSNLPQFKKGRGESFADAATTLLPLAKGTKDFPAGLSFIGPNSKGWDKVAAELAAKKLDEGVDPKQVWQEHMIGRMPSGHLFSEIDDSGAKFNLNNAPLDAYGAQEMPIYDALNHNNLQKEYPDLESLSALHFPSEQYRGASFDPKDKVITFGHEAMNQGKSVSLHELQHAIQNKEGWARGGAPEQMKEEALAMLRRDVASGEIASTEQAIEMLPMAQYNAYRRLTGEAQARATQDRLDMDMAQRRESYPLAGDKLSDISLKDLINKYKGDGPSMSASSDNLNADLLEKYLVTGKLSPEEMATYEANGRLMETPQLQRYNVANAEAQMPGTSERMSLLELNTPSYHASRNKENIHEFRNRIAETSLFNGLGVHSGTKAAAKQRAEDTAGYNRDTGKRNPDMATYYPLQLRANKSFEINGRPTDEFMAELHLDSLGHPSFVVRSSDVGKEAIQDAYFKNNDVLKYINDVEDKGSVSYISPPENIRSRFAAFDPLRKNSTSISASVLGGTALSDLALKYGDNEDVGYASGGAVVKGIKKLAKNLNEALLGKHLAGETLTPEEMIKYEKNGLKMETPNLQHFNVENAMVNPERQAYKANFDTDGYHQSDADNIKYFDNKKLGLNTIGNAANKTIENTSKIGHWFSGRPLSMGSNSLNMFGNTTYPVLLNNIEPVELSNSYQLFNQLDEYGLNKFIKNLDDYGHDSIIINKDVETGLPSIVQRNPKNIRSRFAAFDPLRKASPSLLAGTASGDLLLKYEDKAQDSEIPTYADGGSVDKDSMELNKPQRTPNHPTKSHIVKTMVDGKEKIIRFGEQGAETAGKPKEGESDRMKAKRDSFKARHAKNIAKGPSSAAYWANKVKWNEGGSVEYNPIKIDQIIDATHKELGTGRYADGGSVNTTLQLG